MAGLCTRPQRDLSSERERGHSSPLSEEVFVAVFAVEVGLILEIFLPEDDSF